MTRKQRYKAIIAWFDDHYAQMTTELQYGTPFELLVAVMLSAQCTDARINKTTPGLFATFPTVYDMAQASEEAVYQCIRSVSYPHAKARHLLQTARQIVNTHNGTVPSDFEALLALPGVGRKTANVVSAILWNKPTMGVDTHIFRVANRTGLTRNAKTPLEVEKQLLAFIPVELVSVTHHRLIYHGRYVCTARNPHCAECGIRTYCLHANKK